MHSARSLSSRSLDFTPEAAKAEPINPLLALAKVAFCAHLAVQHGTTRTLNSSQAHSDRVRCLLLVSCTPSPAAHSLSARYRGLAKADLNVAAQLDLRWSHLWIRR
jgi:hypothetical protein